MLSDYCHVHVTFQKPEFDAKGNTRSNRKALLDVLCSARLEAQKHASPSAVNLAKQDYFLFLRHVLTSSELLLWLVVFQKNAPKGYPWRARSQSSAHSVPGRFEHSQHGHLSQPPKMS